MSDINSWIVQKEALYALLGPRPDRMTPQEADAVIERIGSRRLVLRMWPESLGRLTFLHRAFGPLLRDRGGTIDAALVLRREIQAEAVTTFLRDADGERHKIPGARWEGENGRALWWRGEGSVKLRAGEMVAGHVYLEIPEPAGHETAEAPEPWAWRKDDKVKPWLLRPEVKEEALRRAGDGATRKKYLGALVAMHREGDGGLQDDSFRRSLDSGALWPESLAD